MNTSWGYDRPHWHIRRHHHRHGFFFPLLLLVLALVIFGKFLLPLFVVGALMFMFARGAASRRTWHWDMENGRYFYDKPKQEDDFADKPKRTGDRSHRWVQTPDGEWVEII